MIIKNKKDDIIKKNEKKKHKTEKIHKIISQNENKLKNKTTCLQCGKIGHSKTLCPLMKPKIGKIFPPKKYES